MSKALTDTFGAVKHVLDDFYGSDEPRSYSHALESIRRIITECEPDIVCPRCGADYAATQPPEGDPMKTLLEAARVVARSWREDGGGVDGVVDLVYAVEAVDGRRAG